MAYTRNLSKAMEALLEKQSQGLQQQHLRFVEQLHQQNLRMVEEFDRQNQRMLSQMLDLLREKVDEEEETMKDDCGDEHHLADTFQVFNESPKKDSHDIAPGGSLLLANPSEMGLGIVAKQCLPSQELELSGCIGCCEGMATTGQCCEVWQDLTLRAHRMERGRLAPVSTTTDGRP